MVIKWRFIFLFSFCSKEILTYKYSLLGDLLTGIQYGWLSQSDPSKDYTTTLGKDVQTIGIWIWSEPFILHSTILNQDIAVLLMDTQGMFEHQTSMDLTAHLFGLSTLMSSFQV